MNDVRFHFDSGRMVTEYYEKLYLWKDNGV